MNDRTRKQIRKAIAEEAERMKGLTMYLEADDVGDAFTDPIEESEAPPLTWDSATVPTPLDESEEPRSPITPEMIEKAVSEAAENAPGETNDEDPAA